MLSLITPHRNAVLRYSESPDEATARQRENMWAWVHRTRINAPGCTVVRCAFGIDRLP